MVVKPREAAEKSGRPNGACRSEHGGEGLVTRRDVLAGALGSAALFGIGGAAKALAGDGVPVRPPGGQDEGRFMARCTRCMRCYEACPQHAVAPAALEDGVLNLRTPTMDFHAGWCDFCLEHNGGVPLCVEYCPTGALEVARGSVHEDVVIGEALLVKDWCLAYRLTHCRDCYDACEFDAIELDGSKRPHLALDRCNGCGACEYVCRSMTAGTPVAGATHRAIVVVPIGKGGEA